MNGRIASANRSGDFLIPVVATRFRLYFAPSGLAEKFQSVKAAVKGQYGQSSPQNDSVKGLKW